MKYPQVTAALAGTALFACVLAACKAEVPPPALQTASQTALPAVTIVSKLANTKSFRMSSAEFDALVAPYCKKTSSDVDAYDNLAEYSCTKDSGINAIKVGERKNNQQAGTFMMYMSMSLSPASYAPLKTLMEKQLGRPAKTSKDYLSWSYTADKKLNTIGYPVISLNQDGKEKNATFQLGVESGQ